MSRIRSIHPGLWTDEAFMGLSAHARLLLMGLWTEAYDDGVFEWKPLTLKARIFPVDAVDVNGLLLELLNAGVIARLESHEKQPGAIKNFQRYQRPKKPNSSGMLPDEWRDYVGASSTPSVSEDDNSEPVPHQFPTGTEKSPQMDDGGGKREDERNQQPPVVASPGAGDLFGKIWEAFPQNPTSSETKAEAAFDRLKAKDQVKLLSAAEHYRSWFEADCKARKRTEAAGLRFVPHLSTWIESDAWRQADALPMGDITAEQQAALASVEIIDRFVHEELFKACEELRGKPAPSTLHRYAFPKEIVAEARRRIVA